MANTKTLIDLKVEQAADNTFMIHYVVPNYSGTKTKQTSGTINVANITRALDRIIWIIQFLKNPVKGKSMHEIMTTNATLQDLQEKSKQNGS